MQELVNKQYTGSACTAVRNYNCHLCKFILPSLKLISIGIDFWCIHRKEGSACITKSMQICGNYSYVWLQVFHDAALCLSVSDAGILELAQTGVFELELCYRIS